MSVQQTDIEQETILSKFKYKPNHFLQVAAYSDSGNPLVWKLYPLKNAMNAYKVKQRADMEPFPTLFWLSCNDLKARVSILEDQGWIKKFQEKLSNNPTYLNLMHKSHSKYAADRWETLTLEDREIVNQRGWVAALRDVGIGGIRDFTKVKCLHTHYAHYLATKENIIGEWVHNLLSDDCLSESSSNTVLS